MDGLPGQPGNDAATVSVIARSAATKQSSFTRGSGLLRCARNDGAQLSRRTGKAKCPPNLSQHAKSWMRRARLDSALLMLKERMGDSEEDAGSRSIRAYGDLDLHIEIARASSKLYQDGHYANAVEAAVKRLNGLVRMRSDLEVDGTPLMERAFSPSNPILRFNDLTDQSDKDEQKGFMMMFSGAVSGLRNPRAHGFINDDPERALEFIAFVSLLAKLLEGAERSD
jgi:uncharacterized protein (TIGR02391 family)